MVGLAEYFEKNRYTPKYFLGDRVFGVFNKIPFVGTVGNDSVVSEVEGPKISIHLDLPMTIKGNTHNVIFVKHKDVKQYLVPLEEEVKPKKNAKNIR